MQSYTTIIGVIELRLQKQSYDIVQKRFGIGSSTVTLIMKRFKEMGLSIDDLKQMEPRKLETAFYPPENRRDTSIPLPDFNTVHAQMISMGRNADLAYIWLDYKALHPDGYQQSQFYKLYRDYVKENFGAEEATMPVERIPGEKMYIDWVGDQPYLLTDPATGELLKVHIYATTLGFSSCVYAEAFTDEKIPSFIAGTTHALDYYGAVPAYLVPDNLKTAVTKHTRDELLLNSVFSDLEDFYGAVVLPPPPRKPRGKATVENHVRFLEVHLVEKLKEGIYTSMEALNKRIREIVETINRRRFGKRSDIRFTRKDAFEKYDKPRMKQLPGMGYTLCDYRYFSRVPENYHLEYDGHYPLYVTEDSHMPEKHRYYKEVNQHDGAYYRRWASVFGQNTSVMIDRILRSSKHEEQAYNSCAGILHACKDVPHSIVEETAGRCVEANACSYKYFKKVLNAVRNERTAGSTRPGHLPKHDNIRGKEAFQ